MESNQVQSTRTITTNFLRLSIVILTTLVLFTIAAYFIWYTTTGRQLTNQFFPTPQRTISLLKESNQLVHMYKFKHLDNSANVGQNGFFSTDGTYIYLEDNFNIRKWIASSSAATQPTTIRKFFYESGDWYVSDVFEDNFSIFANAYLPTDFIDQVLPKPEYMSKIGLDFTLNSSQKVYTEDGRIILVGIFVKSPWNESSSSLKISINPKNYQDFFISLKDEDGNSITFTPLSDMADIGVTSNLKNVKQNPYGDFFARESVILRTNTKGLYDSLWYDWEAGYFNCYRCVYKYADHDNDGITNAGEFILGTDPKIFTDKNSIRLPVILTNIFTGKDFIRDRRGRTGLAIFSVQKPLDISSITGVQFYYAYPLLNNKEGSYANLYIGNTFAGNLPRTKTETPEFIFMPVRLSDQATTSTEDIIFVLNSLGSKDAELWTVKTDTFGWVSK